MAGQPFVGRAAELAALREALSVVRDHRPLTALVTGPAGIGKTTLVEQFLRGLTDVVVLRANGEQWESLVSFGVVDQLLRAAGAGPVAGSGRSGAAGDAGEAVLAVLETVERTAPVVLLVDDAQWADLDSHRALLYALRRLGARRVLTILVERDPAGAGLPEAMRRLTAGESGRTLAVAPLADDEVHGLASALGAPQLTRSSARRLCAHTGGNPLFVRSLVEELPAQERRLWQRPLLPAPRAFVHQVVARLAACSSTARALVETCAVLGVRSSLRTAATIAELAEPVAAFEEAAAADLLRGTDAVEFWDVAFPHPLVQAAVYEHVRPTDRLRLHRAAAALLDDPGAALRHRVAATTPPDEELAAALDAFAHQEARWGAWAAAASALIESSRLSVERTDREQRLLRAIDAIISAGDLPEATALAQDVEGFAPGPLRDATLAHLAVLHGDAATAESLLTAGWSRCDAGRDPGLAAVLALRRTLHAVGRLDGPGVVTWSRRAASAVPGDAAIRLEAQAFLGLGMGFAGSVADGLATYQSVLESLTGDEGSIAGRVRMAIGWLKVVADDLEGLPAMLAEVAGSQPVDGSDRIAAWADVWCARARFALGEWDDALVAAERAVALLEDTGHAFIGPVAHWVAAGLHAARGDGEAADAHVRRAQVHHGGYELAVVAAALAAAEVAWLRDDHDGVLAALGPVLAVQDRGGVDEPGFWPWQHLYADALTGLGRLADADAFLVPHERLAADRGRRSCVARLARVRGRVEAAAGRPDAAETAIRRGLDQLDGLPLPFDRAMLELAHGEIALRGGNRRAAIASLRAARTTFAALGAVTHVQRCDQRIADGGGTRREEPDPTRLTRQESSVARRAAAGMSNREIADDMQLSIKTVQFHLANSYAKLGVHTRVQLANQLRDR